MTTDANKVVQDVETNLKRGEGTAALKLLDDLQKSKDPALKDVMAQLDRDGALKGGLEDAWLKERMPGFNYGQREMKISDLKAMSASTSPTASALDKQMAALVLKDCAAIDKDHSAGPQGVITEAAVKQQYDAWQKMAPERQTQTATTAPRDKLMEKPQPKAPAEEIDPKTREARAEIKRLMNVDPATGRPLFESLADDKGNITPKSLQRYLRDHRAQTNDVNFKTAQDLLDRWNTPDVKELMAHGNVDKAKNIGGKIVRFGSHGAIDPEGANPEGAITMKSLAEAGDYKDGKGHANITAMEQENVNQKAKR